MTETNTETTLTCANHPNRPTMLRCNRCEKPICTECAVLTPTGYRCKQCVHQQQKIFDTSKGIDYPIAFFLSAGISFFGSLLVGFLGFFTLIAAPMVGVAIAEVVRFATRKRRSKALFITTAIGTVLGALPTLLGPLLAVLFGEMSGLVSLAWIGLYVFIVTSSMYYRLSGIQLGGGRI